MANTQSTISIVVVVAVALFALSSGVSGQSPESAPPPVSGAEMAPAPAPAPSMDCFTPLLNLSECLTYVEAGSKLKTPEKGCCPGLAGLVATSPTCLCQLLANSSINIVGVDVDRSKALSLPKVCKVDAPTSLCSLLGYPVAPAPGPAMNGGSSASAPASPGSLPASQETQIKEIFHTILFTLWTHSLNGADVRNETSVQFSHLKMEVRGVSCPSLED